MKKNVLMGLSLIVLSMVSCRPVLAIGWGEFLILVIAVVVLIGPPVYRFFRRLENSRRKKEE